MAQRKPRVQAGVRSKAAPAPRAWRGVAFLAIPVALAVLSVAVYAPTLDAAWTDTDDIELIVEEGPFLSSQGAMTAAFGRPFFPQADRRSYYRPLVTASFALDVQPDPTPRPSSFHFTNVLLHAGTSVLVFLFASALGTSVGASGAAAAAFALHPATVQAVAWIPGRCDGLMTVFSLASLIAWIGFDRSGSRRAVAVHHAALVAALFSKETAIAIPLVCVSYSAFVTRNKSRLREPLLWVGWFFAIGVWFWARRAAVGTADLGTTPGTIIKNSPALLIGIGKLIVPAEFDVLATLRDSSFVPGAVSALALAAGAFFVEASRRRVFVWAAILFPLLTLAPALGVADFLVLDNRLYLPLSGAVAGAAVVADSVWSRAQRGRNALVGIGCATLVAFGASTIVRERAFGSPRAFSEAAVLGSPHLGLAHLNMGTVEYREGHFDRALREFQRALVENPKEAVAHNNIGLLFLNSGELGRAETEFTSELRSNPNYSKAHFNLGLVFEQMGRIEEARAHFERALALRPTDTEALGELLKYWAPRDAARAETVQKRMEELGVKFFTPDDSPAAPTAAGGTPASGQ